MNRFYDLPEFIELGKSDIARFLSLDPLAANYPSLSDYCYVAGNPVMLVDPSGMSAESTSDLGGTLAPVTVTYYTQYSEAFNQLSEHEKNFLLHKWRTMEEGNLYRRQLGEAIVQGSTREYYLGYMDKSNWWNSSAEANWRKGGTIESELSKTVGIAIGVPLLASSGGGVLAELMPAGGGSAMISSLATNRAGGAIQSGGLNFITQLYGNKFDLGAVDWTGVGSAALTGALTGPGPKSLLIGSSGGAVVDATFDLTYNNGFSTVLAGSDSQYHKPIKYFKSDFTFGFLGNLAGGISSVSGSLGSFNRHSIVMEFFVDAAAINLNLTYNAKYAQ